MHAQTSLFDECSEPVFDALFRSARRIDLGDGAWVEHVPRWLTGHDVLLEHLRCGLRWRAERRPMYDRVVDVPRLLAGFPDDGPLPGVLAAAADALSARYGRDLHRVAAAYYRDGNDSVAMHGDRVGIYKEDTVIGVLGLGHPRRFLLRPVGRGAGRSLALGWGDLLVMGGTCQRTWRHGVPKCASAGPRISIQFRETRIPSMRPARA